MGKSIRFVSMLVITGGFTIIILFGGILIAAGQAAIAGEPAGVSIARTPAQQRMLRILTGRSEKARVNAIERLTARPDQLRANLDVVAEATTRLLSQTNPQDDRGDKAEIVDGARAPVFESMPGLFALLGHSPHPRHADVLIDALNHSDERIAMSAMDTIAEFEITAAVDDLAAQIKRPEFEQQYAFRFSLVRAIASLRCPPSIEWLHRLHAQLQGQLRYEIATRLADVDLRDFAGDRELFAQYQKDHPPRSLINRVGFNDLNPAPPVVPIGNPIANLGDENPPGRLRLVDAPSESSDRKLKLSNSNYYGIELRAGRMLFVIDRSGSMRAPARYATRLQSAKRELVRVIEELHPSNEFSILLFDTYVQPWRNELLPATEQNKREAIAFAERITLGDKTNTHGVLDKALTFDDQLEAVFVLTDGQPTTGQTIAPDQIIREVASRNRTRHLKFHTIGFGVNAMTSDFLKNLAEQTGGEFRDAN